MSIYTFPTLGDVPRMNPTMRAYGNFVDCLMMFWACVSATVGGGRWTRKECTPWTAETNR